MMVKKNPTILFLGILIFSSSIFAYEIQNFNTEIEIYNDGVAKVVNHLILDTANINETFSIPAYSPESVIVTDDKGELKFATLGADIIIHPRERINNYEVRIQYLTSRLTSKKEDIWSATYSIPGYGKVKTDNIKNGGLILSLPKTATITNFSKNGIVFSDKHNIKIGWKLNFKEDEDTKIKVIYNNKIKREIDYIKIAFYTLLTIIFIIISVHCLKIAYCKITKRISKGKKGIIRTLEKREREVVKLLLENHFKLYQSKIQKETSISKATLSRIIKRLENRRILEVRPSGNTNLILLQEWFVKK